MGAACKRQGKTSIKISIKGKVKQLETVIPLEEFSLNQVQGQIGHYFQYQQETQKTQVLQKQKQWDSILEDKQAEFGGIPMYQQLKLSSQSKSQIDQPNEIVNFIELDQRYESDVETPHLHPVKQPSITNSRTQKRKTNQETLLEEYFFNGKCHLQSENEILMYIFNKQMPEQYNLLMRQGLPYLHRWSVWKIRFHDEFYYDPELYHNLLLKNGPDEIGINKDITRTFPKHPYFIQDDQRESLGQTQLFRVLNALSILFPKVGYCQGMNFLAGFFLITNGGNDEEAFWLFKNLLESSEFMMTGSFEVNNNFHKFKVGFPLTTILTDLFKQEFEEKNSELYLHFQNQNIPEQFYVFKWFTTLFIYSFPFSVVYRLWDYIISKNILSSVSISLAILESYQQHLILCDISDVSQFFKMIFDSERILIDPKCEVYLDIDKVIHLADNKYKIKYNLDNQINPYAVKLSNMYAGKIKVKTENKQKQEQLIVVENLS